MSGIWMEVVWLLRDVVRWMVLCGVCAGIEIIIWVCIDIGIVFRHIPGFIELVKANMQWPLSIMWLRMLDTVSFTFPQYRHS